MKKSLVQRQVLAAAVLLAAMGSAHAQDATAEGIAKYREMLQDGNPAELFEMKGEEFWTQKRGPKNATLEKCDFGKGPGVIKGAFVELPRYFADTGRVQDLESRLITCMDTLQGFKSEDLYKAAANYGKGESANLVALTTYIATASKGMRLRRCRRHTKRKRPCTRWASACSSQRGGPHDFACSTCHGVDGQRIRLQDLPNLTKNPGDGVGFAAWPAYRVSNCAAVDHAKAPERLLPPAALPRTQVRQRCHDCLGRLHGRQQPRVPSPSCPPSSADQEPNT